MPEFEVEVEGPRRRKRKPPGKGLLQRLLWLLRFILLRPAVVVVGALALFVWFIGTPHIGVSGAYDSCTYYGIQGARLVYQEPGEICPVVRFVPPKWGDGPEEGALVWADKDRSDDQYPLNETSIRPLYWGVVMGSCSIESFPSPRPVCNRLLDMVRSDEFTEIECIYGPINRDGTGWRSYDFWHNKVPDDLASFEEPGQTHPFLVLGKLAVPSCPETSDEAEKLFQAGRIRS